MTRGMIREADYCAEKYCHKCGEWWPADEDFFYRSTKGHLRSPCRACVLEQKYAQRQNARSLCDADQSHNDLLFNVTELSHGG